MTTPAIATPGLFLRKALLASCNTLAWQCFAAGCLELELLPRPGANAVCSLFSKLAACKAWRRLATPINSKQIN